MGRSRSNLPFLAATEFEDQVRPLFEAKGEDELRREPCGGRRRTQTAGLFV